MASNETSQILANLQTSGLQNQYPTLYDVLRQLVISNNAASTDTPAVLSSVDVITTPDVTTFASTFTTSLVRLTWDNMGTGLVYEVRLGATWASASFVATVLNNSLIISPFTGSRTYSIKAINTSGIYSTNAVTTTIVPVAPGAPSALAKVLIGNYVNLRWTAPATGSFTVDYYIIKKDGVQIGTTKTRFYQYFESTAGTFSYTVGAVDIGGNAGSFSSVVTATLSAIVDYTVLASILSTLNGTKTNTYTFPDLNLGNSLYCCLNLTETWATHFSARSWAGPSAQVAAGYPLFCQPTLSTGSYIETFDFGAIYTDVLVDVTWLTQTYRGITGNVQIQCYIQVSDDNITFNTATLGQRYEAASVRYAKITLNFISDNDRAVIAINNLKCSLDLETVFDSGSISTLSTDVNGTTVTFSKSFKAVSSLLLNSRVSQQSFVESDFQYSPNDSSFQLYLFDKDGVRISGIVNWLATGSIVE